MILGNVCITFQIEFSEEERFREMLFEENSMVTDWNKDGNYTDYDTDRMSHQRTLYDVYFDDVEDAQTFYTNVRDVFGRIV